MQRYCLHEVSVLKLNLAFIYELYEKQSTALHSRTWTHPIGCKTTSTYSNTKSEVLQNLLVWIPLPNGTSKDSKTNSTSAKGLHNDHILSNHLRKRPKSTLSYWQKDLLHGRPWQLATRTPWPQCCHNDHYSYTAEYYMIDYLPPDIYFEGL